MRMGTRCQGRHQEDCMLRRGQDASATSVCRFPRQWEIVPTCADMLTRLPPPFFSSVSLDRAEKFGMGLVGHLWRKRPGLGVVCSGVLWQGAVHFLHLLQLETGLRKDRFFQHGRSSHFRWVLVHMCMGKAPLSGSGAGHCYLDCGGLVAPLTMPWCAEGDVPTAANLNLSRGRFSHVGWHSDNEPLFGERGDRASPVRTVKLARAGLTIVIFWSMPGRVSSLYGSWLEQERINVTFRWVQQRVASCPFLRTGVCRRVRRVHPFLLRSLWRTALPGDSGCSWGSYSHGRYQHCWFTASWVWDLGLIWFPMLHFFSESLILLLVVLGVLSDPAGIGEIRKAWLPYYCRSGQRVTSLEEFIREVEEWLPLLPEVRLPRLTGEMLADVVQRKGVPLPTNQPNKQANKQASRIVDLGG